MLQFKYVLLKYSYYEHLSYISKNYFLSMKTQGAYLKKKLLHNMLILCQLVW